MYISHLRCEYHLNPLGIDVARPRLSWHLVSETLGARQTAYQIEVRDTASGEILWDSGHVPSSQSHLVEYAGPTLRSAQRMVWRVRVWDEDDNPTEWSETAEWEMGLLGRDEWRGHWIGAALVGGPRSTIPCPFVRKSFMLNQPVAHARLYITALGLCDATLNGQTVGDAVLTPGWTDYRKRVRYQTHDVTGLLREGENVLGAVLGDGWYCGHLGWQDRQFYGDRPKLLAQLTITLTDGATYTIVTDASWTTAFGPLLESDLLMGEAYDARQEFPGWDTAGFDEAGWSPVTLFADPGLTLDAQNGPVVRRIEELRPIADPHENKAWPQSRWVFDLGQNMVGRVRFQIEGPRGATIRLRHGEVLNPDGTLYTANLRSARATDYYTCKGEGVEVYEPRFTFHGFRYVEVSGYAGTPTREMVTGLVLHSEMAPLGTFECSEPLLNQLQHNIVWGQKGNFLDVPTDCPQRDERLGWTGDAQAFIRTATFNLNVAPFFTKWLQDLEDAQHPSGSLPSVAPDPGVGEPGDGGPAWADAAVICPWTLYLCYGDVRLLESRYGMMTRFVDHLARSSLNFIRCDPSLKGWEGYGDWLALDGSGRVDGGTPKDLIGTAFLAYSAQLLAQIAEALGRPGDVERYAQLREDVGRAFLNRFVTPDGLVVGGTQTGYVLALAFDLLPEEARPAAVDALGRDIEKRGWHLATGFAGTPFLMQTLTRFNRLDVAFKLLMQTSWPSWLYSVTQGATTIWERWDGWTHDRGFQDPGMNSFNHYAYGAIGAWLYATVAGIDVDAAQPGYRRIVFRPQPGGPLTHAKATLQSPYGLIASEWRLAEDKFEWDIVVPPNTTAVVWVPGEPEGRDMVSGRYHFEAAWPTPIQPIGANP